MASNEGAGVEPAPAERPTISQLIAQNPIAAATSRFTDAAHLWAASGGSAATEHVEQCAEELRALLTSSAATAADVELVVGALDNLALECEHDRYYVHARGARGLARRIRMGAVALLASEPSSPLCVDPWVHEDGRCDQSCLRDA